ncbi:MAG TPA: Hint domain-containing protein [Phycisphaerales bacterium]|nr:Hint domain-containing protein [Phycisphaerales bacterium]
MRRALVTVIALVAAACGGCSSPPFHHCIVAGTPVETPAGPRPIESLRIGDDVITQLPDGTFAPAKITAVRNARVGAHLRIALDGGASLHATPEHPIATPSGFVKAGDLDAGDFVITRDGEQCIVSIATVRHPTRVLDLSVEPGHTFFASGVLVHNKSFAQQTLEETTGTWIGFHQNRPKYRLEVRADGTFTLWSPALANRWSWEGAVPVTPWGRGGKPTLDLGASPIDIVPSNGDPAMGRATLTLKGRLLHEAVINDFDMPRHTVWFVSIKELDKFAARPQLLDTEPLPPSLVPR